MRWRWVAACLLVAAVTPIGGYALARDQVSSSPQGSGGNAQAEQHYIDRAQRQTIAHDPQCKVPTNGQLGPTFVHGAPPKTLLAALGVLRRPALPADRSTRMLFRNGFNVGAGVYVDYIRRARTLYGKSFYLIPEAHIVPFGAIPERCYREMRRALQRDLRRAPSALRAPTLRAQAEQFAIQRQQAKHQRGVCFAAVSLGFHGRLGGVDEGCSPGVNDVHHALWEGIGEGDRAGGTILAYIVPDKVATVTLQYDPAAGVPAATIRSRAVNNVVVFKIPKRVPHQQFPSHVVVRGANGQAITQR
jgi:hypothetical protein